MADALLSAYMNELISSSQLPHGGGPIFSPLVRMSKLR